VVTPCEWTDERLLEKHVGFRTLFFDCVGVVVGRALLKLISARLKLR
jgi:hypothetical protein